MREGGIPGRMPRHAGEASGGLADMMSHMTGTALRGVWVAIIAVLTLMGACGLEPIPTVGPSTTSSATGPGAEAEVSPPPSEGPDAIGTGLGLSILPVGSSEQAITVDGRIRMYRAYRPARLARTAPLVVMFHGGLGSARQAENAYGWDALADREGFVVLYPDGIGAAWNVGGGCCGLAPAQGVNDVAFVSAAIDNLRTRVSLDPGRTYAAGMSAGGMMAYRMACDTTLFAAIGPVAATELGDCPNPAPTSVIHVHGTADSTVPFDGSKGSGLESGLGLAHIEGPTIQSLHTTWRGIGRCGGDIISSYRGVTTETAECPEARTVELVIIEGGGAEWPGVSRSGPLDASPSPTTQPTATVAVPTVGPTVVPTGAAAYDTTAQLWAFFKTHTR